MPISSGLRAIVGVFGPMLDTANRVGRGASDMWDTFKAAYVDLGISRPPATIIDMNVFRYGLGMIQRSQAALGRAVDTDALDAQHFATVPWVESTLADYANPSIVATFQVDVETAGGILQRWSSVAYNSVFPATVGQLRSEATAAVQNQMDEAAMNEGDESPTAGGMVQSISSMYIIGRGV